MRVACLGWGSLVWDPRDLPLDGAWIADGPMLPIEFARESKDGRMTLVIADVESPVQSLWALMSISTLEEAKNQLAAREAVKKHNIKYSIGFWDRNSGDTHDNGSGAIATWAEARSLDAIVWTNFKWGFRRSRDTMPKYSEVKQYFLALDEQKRIFAEEYVRRAHVQIDTLFRRRLQNDFDWTPL